MQWRNLQALETHAPQSLAISAERSASRRACSFFAALIFPESVWAYCVTKAKSTLERLRTSARGVAATMLSTRCIWS